MASENILVDHNFIGAKITGLPAAAANGEAVVYNQVGANANNLTPTGSPTFAGVISTTDIRPHDATMRCYDNVCVVSSQTTVTGTLKITMPKTWSSTMLAVRISGVNFTSPAGEWVLQVKGYNYTGTNSWINCAAHVTGRPQWAKVRLAHDGTSCCLLIGVTSTQWSYARIVVEKVHAAYSNVTGWETGWAASFVASETGISIITDVALTSEQIVGASGCAPMPSILQTSGTATGNVGTGEDVLRTYTVPANTLNVNGSAIRFEFAVQLANSTVQRAARVYFGTDLVYDSGVLPEGDGGVVLRGTIVRTGAATQSVVIDAITPGLVLGSGVFFYDGTQSLASDVVLKLVGEATDPGVTNNLIVAKTSIIEWIPAK